MKRLWNVFKQGLVFENPLLMLMIGLCSALAVTTSVSNAVGMGLAMTFVLLFSEILISAFRKVIPDSVRMPIFIIIIAAFTTIIDYTMQAYFPELSKSMGVFIPLIVVNCIIMGRVEAFSYKQKVLDCIADSFGMGLGYTWVMVGIATIREILGNGSFAGMQVMPESFHPILFFTLSPGGFLVFALFISFNLWLKGRMAKSKAAKAASVQEEAA
jgi:Na+-translocating ferredoxin:NAD+ oxidoreductase subunit E